MAVRSDTGLGPKASASKRQGGLIRNLPGTFARNAVPRCPQRAHPHPPQTCSAAASHSSLPGRRTRSSPAPPRCAVGARHVMCASQRGMHCGPVTGPPIKPGQPVVPGDAPEDSPQTLRKGCAGSVAAETRRSRRSGRMPAPPPKHDPFPPCCRPAASAVRSRSARGPGSGRGALRKQGNKVLYAHVNLILVYGSVY